MGKRKKSSSGEPPPLKDSGVGLNLAKELLDERNDPYHRLKLIRWWDQDKLRSARVMVIGAGAIGNEIIKNLALLGIGQILVCDLDLVEPSNLSRSILFRREDEGKPKAKIAAERAMEINPDIRTAWLYGDVVCDLGLGVFRRMDLVLGGLDNREARVAVNSACWRMGVPFVDGGTHTFEGQVRVFAPPEGPCYECTLSAEQYEAMQNRIRCNLLLDMTEQEAVGKVATTPIAASIIAAIQVQEALEILHGMEAPRGQAIVYNGPTHEMYVSKFDPKDSEWHQHSMMESCVEVTEIDELSSSSTAAEVLTRVRDALGDNAVIDLGRNIVSRIHCTRCSCVQEMFRPLNRLQHSDLLCPRCSQLCDHELIYTIRGDEWWLGRELRTLGIPPLDVLCAHNGQQIRYFEMSGDAPAGGFWRGEVSGSASLRGANGRKIDE